MQGIGVDADQAYLGPQVFTSALKKVDVAVLDAIKRAQDGKFAGGTDLTATVKTGGVGHRQVQHRRPEVRRPGQEGPGPDRRRPDRQHPGHGRREVAPQPTMEQPLALQLRGITKRFGAIVANDGVDFELSAVRSTRCWARTAPASRR